MKTTYKIQNTNNGMIATVTLAEGVYCLVLTYKTGLNNTRVWEVKGSYPKEKYSITYEQGQLFILAKGGSYEVGQIINHKAFGEGVILNVTETIVTIDFKAGQKSIMKSILNNFIK